MVPTFEVWTGADARNALADGVARQSVRGLETPEPQTLNLKP